MDAFKKGSKIQIDFINGIVKIEDKEFAFAPLSEKLMNIFEAKGLVNFVKNT